MQVAKLGVLIQDICYQMGTEIFKIEEEMTEKMKPKVFCILDEFVGSFVFWPFYCYIEVKLRVTKTFTRT